MAATATTQKGFTLIELMVVLIIMALMSALVLPKFPAIYEKFLDKGDRDAFNQSLASLGVKAYTQQKQITLNQTTASQLLEIPSGWEIKIDEPIIYRANGVCLGGTINVHIKEVRQVVHLNPPFCEPEVSE